MGLTLRKLEQEGEIERRQNLRRKIFDKYEIKGLHIAQFVENGILNRYIGILIDNIISLDKFRKDIMYVLKNIENIFVNIKPYAVDLVSSVEKSPGKKDKEKLKEFFNTINKLSNKC